MISKIKPIFPILCMLNLISTFAACPKETVKVVVYNTSHNILKLETKEENTCKLHLIANVRPGIKGKYCIKHDYLLKVTTLSLKGGTRLAITSADLWDDLVISTPKELLPDVKIHHLHNDIKFKYHPKVIIKEEGTIDNEELQKTLKDAKTNGSKKKAAPNSTKKNKPDDYLPSLLD